MNFEGFQQNGISLIDQASTDFITKLSLADHLKEAILYSYNAGGKRIRPLLLLSVLESFQCEIEKGVKTAAALELIHTSSLIHDDLPAMDDDDYRRGKLTNHKVYGEATAILAGDALLVNAFELITEDALLTNHQKVSLIRELAQCSGANGMIGGQELDIENETKAMSVEELMCIHQNKTGRLLEFALVAGGIISNQSADVIQSLRESAYHIGMAFQIKDDILDVVGDAKLLGKPVNSDEKNNKTTYVSLLGLEEANQRLNYHYTEAIDRIEPFMNAKKYILSVYNLIVKRNN